MKRIEEARRWRAVAARDARADGSFVYAVTTTGVYCRPSCPSRRPARRHVVFFPGAAEAQRDGYRPCLRCAPGRPHGGDPAVGRVRALCRFIDGNPETPHTLRRLADRAGMSPFHLQRTFRKVTGVTPRQYADERRRARLKRHLKEGRNVTEAMYEAGYGSSSRLYETSDAGLGMTPRAYRRGGAGASIRYTIARSPLGLLLVAATGKGICRVALGDAAAGMEADLRREFPAAAATRRDDAALGRWVAAILANLDGRRPHLDLPLDIRATAFQRRVWEALRAIPRGATRSYGDIARAIGSPGAARAVGAACAANPVALVIPCHRAVRGDGGTGGYRWGAARKRRLLDREAAARVTRRTSGTSS